MNSCSDSDVRKNCNQGVGCPLSKREHFFPLRSKAKSVMHCFFSLRANYILSFGHEPIWAIYVLVSLSFSGYCTNGHKDFYSIATGCLYPLYIFDACVMYLSSIFFFRQNAMFIKIHVAFFMELQTL